MNEDLELEINDEEDEDKLPIKPTIDTRQKDLEEREVLYDWVRQPGDVVLSGPVIGGWGPGRYHMNRLSAKKRLIKKFGANRIRDVPQTAGRWAFLVKGLQNAS